FACRTAVESPRQTEITAYLMARLTDPKAPGWLRRFAMFELLNGRGEAARRSALGTFRRERTARLRPAALAFKFSTQHVEIPLDANAVSQYPLQAITRDASGRWWAAFNWDYLGNYGLWFVQSRDKKRWVKPAFGFDFVSGYKIGLTCYQDKLKMD